MDDPRDFMAAAPKTVHSAGCICLSCEIDQAERKAWDSLARYKFQMFGYWAGIWVHLNRIGRENRPNPFRGVVQLARDHGKVCCFGERGNARSAVGAEVSNG